MLGQITLAYFILATLPLVVSSGLRLAPEWALLCPLLAVRGGKTGIWVAAVAGLCIDALSGGRLGLMLAGLAAGTAAIGAMLAARPRMSAIVQGLAAGLVLFALQVLIVHVGRWRETGVRPTLSVAPGEFELWVFTAGCAAIVVSLVHRPTDTAPFASERFAH
jgi:rod shape-determining protein MreD